MLFCPVRNPVCLGKWLMDSESVGLSMGRWQEVTKKLNHLFLGQEAVILNNERASVLSSVLQGAWMSIEAWSGYLCATHPLHSLRDNYRNLVSLCMTTPQWDPLKTARGRWRWMRFPCSPGNQPSGLLQAIPESHKAGFRLWVQAALRRFFQSWEISFIPEST